MAQRLATEYVKACLTVTESELTQMEKMLQEHGVDFRVMVFDNGSQQLTFHEESGEEVVISFERRGAYYVSEGSYRLNTMPLANLMRKAVSHFKGDAIVNRIYSNFTMVYYYERGTVVKIVEMNEHYQKVIYEFKNPVGRLEMLYQEQQIESEIVLVREQINQLLDERLTLADQDESVRNIDRRLGDLTHQLFVLEA